METQEENFQHSAEPAQATADVPYRFHDIVRDSESLQPCLRGKHRGQLVHISLPRDTDARNHLTK
jgi:hypothetical protein